MRFLSRKQFQWAMAVLFAFFRNFELSAAVSTNLTLKESKLANSVILDEIAVKNLRIETVTVEEQTFEETIFALGRIDVRPGFSAILSSRIPGRALKVEALPDHEVKEGEALVIVESRQPGSPPPQVTLTAPISGIISEINIVPGQPISPDNALLRIVQLESVYGIARIPESLASQLHTGLKATVTVPGWKGIQWNTQIEHLGAVADPESGTLEAAFHIKNDDLKLRPGMRAEFSIVVDRRDGVMSVPLSAVQGDAASRFVFVADDSIPHAFIKVPVEIGAMNERFAEITRGLFPGDRVVTEGAYSLGFAGKGTVSLKEALDAAHGHEHNPDGSDITPEQKATQPKGRSASHAHGFSTLTLFSLIGNAILLILLAFAARRRATASRSSDPPE